MYGDIRSCVSSVEEVKVKTQLELRKQGRLEEMVIEDEQASFQDGFDESRRLGRSGYNSAGWKECNDDSDCKPWEYCSSYKRNGRATGATIRAVSCGSYYIIKNS